MKPPSFHFSNREEFEKALNPHMAPIDEQTRVTGHPKQLFYSLLAREMGHLKLVEVYLLELVELRKGESFFYLMLVEFYLEGQRMEEALFWCKRLLESEASCVEAHEKIAYLWQVQGHYQLAIDAYHRALALDPKRCPNWYHLGLSLDALGRTQEALDAYQRALDLQPSFVPALNNRGNILASLERFDEAMACFQASIAFEPDLPDAYINLANSLQTLEYLEKAMVFYQKALLLDPNSSIAHYNLANCYRPRDKMKKALFHYQRAVACDPDLYLAHWGSCMCSLLKMHKDVASIEISRESYSRGLADLEALPLDSLIAIGSASEAVGEFYPFYLAYQMKNDRDLQKRYGALAARIMALRYPHLAIAKELPKRREGRRIRLGIVSKFFQRHSVWKIPLAGWMEGFDRNRFEIYSYSTGGKRDEVNERAQQLSDRFIYSSKFEPLANQIASDQLDILIFPEIGMDGITLRLAALRLAPIQCTGLGHPQTTGLPTMDYFFSSEWMETPHSEEHYSETLVRLPHFGCYYLPNQTPHDPKDWISLGIRENAVKYLCCQSLFKYLPHYDWIWPLIALKVPTAQFIFTSSDPDLKKDFLDRLEKEFLKLDLVMSDYVVMLERLPVAQFVALCRVCDLFLDSIGWSGFNSTIEALEQHLPVVTLPGEFARSRHSYAVLRHLQLDEMIVWSSEEYVALACRWAVDPELRSRIKQQVIANVSNLYEDSSALSAMEDFLESLVPLEVEQHST